MQSLEPFVYDKVCLCVNKMKHLLSFNYLCKTGGIKKVLGWGHEFQAID
jgi:hypothetical protein